MYTRWFKLDRLPFRLRPDPTFLFVAGENARRFRSLQGALATGRGPVCLTGEAGTGKTTMLQAITGDAQHAPVVVQLLQPNLSTEELLHALYEQLGISRPAPDASSRLRLLTGYFAEQHAAGKRVIIVADDAHLLSSDALAELLTFAALPLSPTLILAGEALLLERLSTPSLAAWRKLPIQRLALARLKQSETEGYVRHRLEVAGAGKREIFRTETFREIQRYTGGTPRLINTLCDSALMQAEAHHSESVGVGDIHEAVQELKWVEFSARRPEPQSAPEPAVVPESIANTTPSPALTRPEPEPPAAVPAVEKLAPARPLSTELLVSYRGATLSRLSLKPGKLVVGRAEGAGLQLNSNYISRQHCQIVTTAESSYVEDLNSTNGTMVNGRRQRVVQLRHRDVIGLGEHTLTYLVQASAEA